MQTIPNLLEDTPTLQEPLPLSQVRRFLQTNTPPVLFLDVIYKAFPLFQNTIWNGHVAGFQHMAEMRLLQAVADDLQAANQAYADRNTKAVKPAELYRKYAKVLRAVKENGQQKDTRTLAGEALNDLFLSQTLSAGELETPDWIDPYTGELDPTYEPDWELDSLPDLMARIELVSPVADEAYKRALELQAELGWGQAEVNAFLKAQGGLDGYDGEAEEMDDDRGYVPPTGERNLTIDNGAFALATPAIAGFNRWRTETFAHMKLTPVKGTWHERFMDAKAESEEVATLVNTIAEVANSYDITTAAAIALKIGLPRHLNEDDIADIVEHEGEDEAAKVVAKSEEHYGLIEDDLEGIGGFTESGVYYDLNEYIEEWGDDVMEIMQDSLSSSPTSDIELFDDTTLAQLTEVLPDKHHNPMQTKSYVMAYMKAIMGGAKLGEAENSAMAEWRMAMSPAGAQAYLQTWQKTHSKSQAMRAFWQKAGPGVPRPQDQVKAIRGNFSGLVLASGRKIDWSIAAMKAKNDEITWEEGQKEKLKTLLVQKGLRNNPILKHL